MRDAAGLAGELSISDADADRLLITLADWDAIEPLPDDAYSYRSRFAEAEAGDATALLDRARQSTYRALSTPKRIVVLEFPSVERACAWWDAPEAAHVKALRQAAARTRMIAVEGI